jgi:hypothetical protein
MVQGCAQVTPRPVVRQARPREGEAASVDEAARLLRSSSRSVAGHSVIAMPPCLSRAENH